MERVLDVIEQGFHWGSYDRKRKSNYEKNVLMFLCDNDQLHHQITSFVTVAYTSASGDVTPSPAYMALVPEPPLVETVSKCSLFGSLLSRTLPEYSGPFSVGVSDVELPVPRQSFGTFTHRKLPEREAGLQMDTVLFSLFYPTEDGPSSKHVVWFPK